VKLPADSQIATEKLTRYLLVPLVRGDKSAFLAMVGFSLANAGSLADALRNLLKDGEALPTENSLYGQFYEIRGRLTGPSGRALMVKTVWMTEHLSGRTKFITLVPDRGN
jgi:hypothetical protein